MEAKELVIVALGSVQSFIAVSRRIQDLLTSSQLLSLLARVGVETAAALPDVEMVFPGNINGEWPQSIPNRFVFITSNGCGAEVANLVEQCIKKAWNDTAAQIKDFFSHVAPEPGWEQIWKRQVETGPEVYWVAFPWKTHDDYGTTYQRACLALDARKRVRWYPTDPEPGEKCTLDGIHQVLSGSRTTDYASIRYFWQKVAQQTPSQIRDGERLCAISVIKRFAAKENVNINGKSLSQEQFPATSSIAAAKFRHGVLEHWTSLGPYIQKHYVALNELSNSALRLRRASPEKVPFFEGKPGADILLSYDGYVFYRETFTPARMKEMLGSEPEEKAIKKAQHTLFCLLQQAKKQKISLPHSYLAVLMLDGDEMGKLLGECRTPEQHKNISSTLTNLIEGMRNIVECEHPGCLVYAGGDDVLALLPVQDALPVANALQQHFCTQLEQEGYSGRSASCGIALVHYLQPLSWALQVARQAVERAKNQPYNRASLVVELIHRSGERVSVGAKWNYDGQAQSTLEIMKTVQESIHSGDVSGKIGYDVLQVAPVLIGKTDASHRIKPEARKAELKRLFKRRAANNKQAQENIARLAEAIANLIEEMPGVNPIKEVARWLILARFLVQGGDK